LEFVKGSAKYLEWAFRKSATEELGDRESPATGDEKEKEGSEL
jgi:hypothetical protein